MNRLKWPGAAVVLGALCALVRRWQMNTAFEEPLGLLKRGAPAAIAMTAMVVLCGAVFLLLAHTAPCRIPHRGRMCRWDLVFAAEGDSAYMGIMVLAALLTAAACPLLLKDAAEGIALWRAMKAVGVNSGSNGLLQVVLALCALLGGVSLILAARGAYRMMGRGRENGALLLPVLLGCVWILEAYRENAPDPVRWDYVPLLVAIAFGLLFYLESAALSFDAGRPRLVLWLAAMTVVTGGAALAAVPGLATAALLLGQTAAALAALWAAPQNLKAPPGADRFGLRARLRQGLPLNEEDEHAVEEPGSHTQEIEEEDTHV